MQFRVKNKCKLHSYDFLVFCGSFNKLMSYFGFLIGGSLSSSQGTSRVLYEPGSFRV